MTSRSDIFTLLSTGLNQTALKLGTEDAKFEVQNYTSPAEIERYCLANAINVLFTIRCSQGTASRYLQNIPYTNKTDFVIGIYCVFRDGNKKGEYANLRDAAVLEVQRLFKANPTIGREKNTPGDDDRVHGSVYVLNSSVTITKKTQT